MLFKLRLNYFFKQGINIIKNKQIRYYHTNVLDHFRNPRNIGSLNKNDTNVGSALVGKAACGDVIKLDIKVDENNIITDSKFKTFGCAAAIASSSVITELIKGRHVNEADKIKNTDISSYLKLPPVKIHCSILAEEAMKEAINDYKKKNNVQ